MEGVGWVFGRGGGRDARNEGQRAGRGVPGRRPRGRVEPDPGRMRGGDGLARSAGRELVLGGGDNRASRFLVADA